MIIKKRKIELQPKNEPEKNLTKEEKIEDSIDLFNLDNIEFSQRQERRRGNRRRGYRRIDDRNLISRAQEEAGTIRDSAAKEGYNAGIEKAAEDILQLKNSVKVFMNTPKEVFDEISPQILAISVDIAEKIIKKEVKEDSTIILGVINDVLKSISKDERKIVIKVCPSQIQLVKDNLTEISKDFDTSIDVTTDDTIEEGGCIIQTKNGIVDASIKTQLEIIKEAWNIG